MNIIVTALAITSVITSLPAWEPQNLPNQDYEYFYLLRGVNNTKSIALYYELKKTSNSSYYFFGKNVLDNKRGKVYTIPSDIYLKFAFQSGNGFIEEYKQLSDSVVPDRIICIVHTLRGFNDTFMAVLYPDQLSEIIKRNNQINAGEFSVCFGFRIFTSLTQMEEDSGCILFSEPLYFQFNLQQIPMLNGYDTQGLRNQVNGDRFGIDFPPLNVEIEY